jgi:hypothetical protein
MDLAYTTAGGVIGPRLGGVLGEPPAALVARSEQ